MTQLKHSQEYMNAASFNDADLTGAVFYDCFLNYAQFASAALDGSEFRCSELSNADFRNARLVGADMTYAYMPEARFEGADLRRVDLDQACLHGAKFDDATKLAGIRNLDGVSAKYVFVNGQRLDGSAALAWLRERAAEPA